MLECLAMLIPGGVPMVQTSAFGMITVFMLPTSLSLPVLSIDLSVKLFAHGLTLMFRLL